MFLHLISKNSKRRRLDKENQIVCKEKFWGGKKKKTVLLVVVLGVVCLPFTKSHGVIIDFSQLREPEFWKHVLVDRLTFPSSKCSRLLPGPRVRHTTRCLRHVRQQVLRETNASLFLSLLDNAIISLNYSVWKLYWGDIQTERQIEC
jgi:hypothetical protein